MTKTFTTARRLAAAAIACVAMIGAASAADVYRWVDDKGVTNVSDTVPEKYKATAQKVDVQPAVSASTAGSAAAATTSAFAAAPARRGSPVPAAATTARAASGAGSLSSTSADGDDCATLQRRYKESQECFGPQPRTVNGAINGARAPQCPVVVDPSPRCGLPDAVDPPVRTTAP